MGWILTTNYSRTDHQIANYNIRRILQYKGIPVKEVGVAEKPEEGWKKIDPNCLSPERIHLVIPASVSNDLVNDLWHAAFCGCQGCEGRLGLPIPQDGESAVRMLNEEVKNRQRWQEKERGKNGRG